MWEVVVLVPCSSLLALGASAWLHTDTVADHTTISRLQNDTLPHTLSTHVPSHNYTNATTTHTWTGPAA